MDWDAYGRLQLIAGADHGHIWYRKPEHFGSPASGDPVAPLPREGEEGFGPRDDA